MASALPATVVVWKGLVGVSRELDEQVFRGPARYGDFVADLEAPDGVLFGHLEQDPDSYLEWLDEQIWLGRVVLVYIEPGQSVPSLIPPKSIAVTKSPDAVAALANAAAWQHWAIAGGPDPLLEAAALRAQQPAPGPVPVPAPAPAPAPLAKTGVLKLGVVGWSAVAAAVLLGGVYLYTRR